MIGMLWKSCVDWSSFDSRRNARASEGANDVTDAIEAAANKPDMFGSAGVVTE